MAKSHQNTDSKYTSFTGHRKWVRAAKFSPNGKLISACGDDKLRICDTFSGECVRTRANTVHSSPENDVAFHSSGNFLVTGGDDDTIRLLDLLEGRPIYTRCSFGNLICIHLMPIALATNKPVLKESKLSLVMQQLHITPP
ncbi:PREDICTED: POC1 centriolar protein homolog [Rhagoletis zephyria]|uniref:POC1 centriolar protein homolog n=1 Tax=Rhagoletis zephyria TaxID=28612 RepID=UPI00081164CE|nr:PREDICTED: POC1 centriolar protein homolog [Rhagoletis zephyria]